MRVLLIITKGSKCKKSNDEVRRVADRINENLGPAFSCVKTAFLKTSSPLADSAIADLIDDGATEIKVLPYFLTAESNVTKKIPTLIEKESKKYPNVNFEILPHFGALQGISTLILNHIYKSFPASNDAN